ncbi:Flavohemoprotein [Streptomyces violarus]
MVTTTLDARRARRIAEQVPDPELPMLTLADLGVLREVSLDSDGTVVASLTPTYSGCPAMAEMRAGVAARLKDAGYACVEIRTVLDPPWTSDWITPQGRRKLAEHGIAPPGAAPARRRTGPARAVADPPLRGLPPLRQRGHRGDLPLRRHVLQGAVALPRLPRAVRVRQGDLMEDLMEPAPAPAPRARARRRPVFHPLRVAAVQPLCEDAVAVGFDIPAELAEEFAFAPGQSLTLRREVDGRDERRSYSICSPVGTAPRIGVRVVPGGLFSSWLVREVRPGDTVEVMAPTGAFTPDLTTPGHHVLIAAGSGITPMVSIAESVLAADSRSTVTLLYGNRRTGTVMFADELADLKDLYPTRFQLAHVLSREPREAEVLSGRLDAERLSALIDALVDVESAGHWWLCGPHGMVRAAQEVLAGLGVPGDRVHQELFYADDEPVREGTGRIVILNNQDTSVIAHAEVDLGHSDGAYHRLVNRRTGQVIGTGGRTNDANIGNGDVPDVRLEDAGSAADKDTQYWHVVTRPQGGTTLLNKSGGRAAAIWTGTASAGQRIGQWVDDNATGTWKVIRTDDGHYRFQAAKNPDLYLTGASRGAPLTLQHEASDGSQEWRLVRQAGPRPH